MKSLNIDLNGSPTGSGGVKLGVNMEDVAINAISMETMLVFPDQFKAFQVGPRMQSYISVDLLVDKTRRVNLYTDKKMLYEQVLVVSIPVEHAHVSWK